jgi:hypothetical protein
VPQLEWLNSAQLRHAHRDLQHTTSNQRGAGLGLSSLLSYIQATLFTQRDLDISLRWLALVLEDNSMILHILHSLPRRPVDFMLSQLSSLLPLNHLPSHPPLIPHLLRPAGELRLYLMPSQLIAPLPSNDLLNRPPILYHRRIYQVPPYH